MTSDINAKSMSVSVSANSISVDCTGQYAALSGRKGISLIDLDRPKETHLFFNLPPSSKTKSADVTLLQWSPHMARSSYVACVINDVVQVWDLASVTDTHMAVDALQQFDHGIIVGESPPPHPPAPPPPSRQIANALNASTSASSSLSLVLQFRAHRRPISDIGWSFNDPNLLATCGSDGYLCIWDVRSKLEKPARRIYANTTDGSQLRWNHFNTNIVTTNEGEVRIWDTRKDNQSSAFITAHSSKVTGIDWSPMRSTEFVTVASDRHIKIWDTRSTRTSNDTTLTGYPLWKVRYTPFGDGLVTVAQRADFQVRVWSLVDGISNIGVFSGHKNIIKSIDFRTFESNQSGMKEFQLLTLSKDQTMRQWTLDAKIQQDCGYRQGSDGSTQATAEWTDHSNSVATEIDRISTRQRTHSRKLSNASQIPMVSYAQECNMVAREFGDRVSIEEINASSRGCVFRITIKNDVEPSQQRPQQTIDAQGPRSVVVRLRVSFPVLYPFNIAPEFGLLPVRETSISMGLMRRLNEKLDSTAAKCVAQNQICIKECINMVIEGLENHFLVADAGKRHVTPKGGQTPTSSTSGNVSNTSSRSRRHSLQVNTGSRFPRPSINSVPAPPTSFAKFSPTGQLIIVSSLSFMKAGPPRDIPRTFSLQQYVKPQGLPAAIAPVSPIESQAFFRFLNSGSSHDGLTNPSSRETNDISLMQREQPVNQQRQRPPNQRQTNLPKYDTRVHIYDMRSLLPISQTMARLLSISDNVAEACERNRNICFEEGKTELAHIWQLVNQIVKPANCTKSDPSSVPWALHPLAKRSIRNIIQYCMERHDIQTLAILSCILELPYRQSYSMPNAPVPRRSLRLVDSQMVPILDHVRRFYAEILHRWGLNLQRSEISKFIETPGVAPDAEESKMDLHLVDKDMTDMTKISCCICHLPVRGLGLICSRCGHTGHLGHMKAWFSKYASCPSGCTCECFASLSGVMG